MTLIRAKAVSYRYPNSNFGLPRLSLEIHNGEFVHIDGPSGSGKSTLARCLTSLIPHLYRGDLEGEVWIRGLRTSKYPLWKLTEAVGMVFQNPAAQMLGITVEDEIIFGLENLGLSPDEIQERLVEILNLFNAN